MKSTINVAFAVVGALTLPQTTDLPADTAPADFNYFLVIQRPDDLKCPAGQHPVIDISQSGRRVTISCVAGE